MKLILSIIFIISFANSYSQVEFYECPITSKNEFVKNDKLKLYNVLSQNDTLFYGRTVDTGHSIVFKYENFYSCDSTFHDAVSASLIWTISDNVTSFEITFNQIDSVRNILFYKSGCGPPCKKYNFDLIDGNGMIKGYLDNKLWKITGILNLVLINRKRNLKVAKTISFNNSFTLWKQKGKDRKGHRFNGF